MIKKLSMAIEVGAKMQGKVSGITKFGAFVDLDGGKTGLVHISEVSSQYVNDINEILSVGDDVNVKVMSIGDDGKVALSIRRFDEDSQKKNRPRQQRHQQKAPRQQRTQDFDTMLNNFMKDSDERLSSLRRNTEGKRGGRGGRRS